MNDFETVRNGLHYYGDTIPNDPEVLAESDAALDRIEAEVAGQTDRADALEELARITREKLEEAVAEVERLTKERDEAVADRIRVAGERNLAQEARTKDGEHYRAAIERLRNQLGKETQNKFKHVAEVERLRVALEPLAALDTGLETTNAVCPYCDRVDNQHEGDCPILAARAALAKEEA